MNSTRLIVIGGLNTDLIGSQFEEFPKPNDPVYGGHFKIGPGGKPGNIASMAARLMPPDTVALISKTVEDEHGLWRYPVDNLHKYGVDTRFVKILKASETDKNPGLVFICVTENGDNMCFIMNGITDDISPEDVDVADELFQSAAMNNGILGVVLECPLPTIRHAISKAAQTGLRIVVDPGGITAGIDISDIIAHKPYLIKPNEHEARIITGVTVSDMASAVQAADRLRSMGAQNVMITHGPNGAYLFEGDEQIHLPAPKVSAGTQDATGCGDQTMAALCAALLAGQSLTDAARQAVAAGTLEFNRLGIQPISVDELKAAL